MRKTCVSSTLVQYIIIFVLTMLNFHQNTKVHKHYIDFVIFFFFIIIIVCISWVDVHLYRIEKEDYRDLFRSILFHFYMEIITLHFVCTCVNLCFSHFSSLQATTKIDYMKYLLLCMCVFFSLNIAINTTSLGSRTHMSINTDSFHFSWFFCNVNIAN